MDNGPVAFIDVETTGLDPDRHEIWEVGLILPDGTEHVWQLPVDLGRADPIALNIGRFHERRASGWRTWSVSEDIRDGSLITDPTFFAGEFVRLTHNLHLVGAVVSFDAERLWRLLRAKGQCPMWHYHLIDVEALAAGFLRGHVFGLDRGRSGTPLAELQVETEKLGVARPPWDSKALSLAVGVDPGQFDRHTALGDARWARAIYEAVMGQ